MLPKHIRRKLSEIGRDPKAAEDAKTSRRPKADEAPRREPLQPSGQPGLTRSRLRQERGADTEGEREPARPRHLGPAQPLKAVCPGQEVETEFGVAWVMRTPAASFRERESIAPIFLRAIERPQLLDMHRDFRWLSEAAREDILFLDTETAGLSSVPLFLCGLMHVEGDEFVIEQLFARDYAEEPALLARTREILEGHELLITYNGKTFDIPFIHDRLAYHLMDWRFEGRHLDLLQHARRRYRRRLPDCKLQTLEQHLCGRPPRADDIAGEEIPRAYHDFVASSNASILRPIIEHNALDLLTLAEITVRMTQPEDGPPQE